MNLNLGAGDREVPGFVSRDGKTGDSLFPLPDADNSVECIRASHVLEHFPHGQTLDVLKDWARVLQPGGTLKIAVPDFSTIAQLHLSGEPIPAQGFVMGGQIDDLDFHKALFHEAQLSALMRAAGLVSIRRWKSDIEDCAALPISLNLAGNKPQPAPKVSAVLSIPRLGFNDFWACAFSIFAPLGIPLRTATGAYWDRDLTHVIQSTLEEDDPEWILTCDYDSVFTEDQVQALLDLASRYPHADAIAPLQTARWHNAPMFTLESASGEKITDIPRESLIHGEMLRAKTAHFGLTLIRVSALKDLPKPWFQRIFTEDGEPQGEGALDPDVNFWHQWKEAGKTLYVALRVPIGHCELMVRWPDINLEAMFQMPGEFKKSGAPAQVWR